MEPEKDEKPEMSTSMQAAWKVDELTSRTLRRRVRGMMEREGGPGAR